MTDECVVASHSIVATIGAQTPLPAAQWSLMQPSSGGPPSCGPTTRFQPIFLPRSSNKNRDAGLSPHKTYERWRTAMAHDSEPVRSQTYDESFQQVPSPLRWTCQDGSFLIERTAHRLNIRRTRETSSFALKIEQRIKRPKLCLGIEVNRRYRERQGHDDSVGATRQ